MTEPWAGVPAGVQVVLMLAAFVAAVALVYGIMLAVHRWCQRTGRCD